MLGVTRHGLDDDARKRGMEIRHHLVQRRGRRENDLEHELIERLSIEWNPAGDAFIENDTHGVDVAPSIRRTAAARLLGRHVIRGAHHRARARHLHAFAAQRLELRDPEIDDFDVIAEAGLLLEHENVIRLQIAVNDARSVGGTEPLRDLQRDRRHVFGRHPSEAANARRQWFSIQELEHHEVRAVRQRAQIEHLEDVVVADFSGGLSLPFEARRHVRTAGERGVQHLDGDASLDPDVLALEDRAHPPFPDHADDAVLPLDDLAGLK